jgi:hypothetical protein
LTGNDDIATSCHGVGMVDLCLHSPESGDGCVHGNDGGEWISVQSCEKGGPYGVFKIFARLVTCKEIRGSGAVIADSLPRYELDSMMFEGNGLPAMARGVGRSFENVATTASMASLDVALFISLVQMRTSHFGADFDQLLGKGH